MSDVERSDSQSSAPKSIRVPTRLQPGDAQLLATMARELRVSESEAVRLAIRTYVPVLLQVLELGGGGVNA